MRLPETFDRNSNCVRCAPGVRYVGLARRIAPGLAVALGTLVIAFWPGRAFAEQAEWALGVEGGLVLPSFDSKDPAAFTLAAWSVGGLVQYGLLDDLWLQGRFSFSAFEGEVATNKTYLGRDLEGVLGFNSLHLHPELGVRYNLLGGYDFAVHVEAQVGFMWSVYRDQTFVNEAGLSYGLKLDDNGEGAMTLGGGLVFEYRFFDFVLVAAGLEYVEVLTGALFERQVIARSRLILLWM